MKKIVLAVSLALTLASFGADAVMHVEGKNPPTECMRSYTPLSINIITPVGLPPGFWDVKGLQIGVWNWVEDFDGWQIGVVNVIQDNDMPFFPIVNWYF